MTYINILTMVLKLGVSSLTYLTKAFAHIFNPIAEIVILVEVPNKEAKAEIEIHQVLAEAKMRKSSI